MTLSEKLALDTIVDLKLEVLDDAIQDISSVLIVARDNGNWDLVDDLIDKMLAYIMRG